MNKYKITFDFDIEEAIDYDSDDYNIEIIEIKDDCFDEMLDTEDKIKEFQNWFNDGMLEPEKLDIIDIVYDRDGEGTGILEVNTEQEIKDEDTFANELVSYLFEGEHPSIEYHITGTTCEDYWDYYISSPEQRLIDVDREESGTIYSYSNVTITKI